MIYQGSVALYTLKVEFASWIKSDKKGRLRTVSKTGKLIKNVAQMRLAGERNKAWASFLGLQWHLQANVKFIRDKP